MLFIKLTAKSQINQCVLNRIGVDDDVVADAAASAVTIALFVTTRSSFTVYTLYVWVLFSTQLVCRVFLLFPASHVKIRSHFLIIPMLICVHTCFQMPAFLSIRMFVRKNILGDD